MGHLIIQHEIMFMKHNSINTEFTFTCEKSKKLLKWEKLSIKIKLFELRKKRVKSE